MTASLAYKLRQQPLDVRKTFLDSLSQQETIALAYDVQFVGRPEQLMPSPKQYRTVFALAGRGFGKTFMGAHATIGWARAFPGCRIALVGETSADVRDVMVKGESGIIAWSHPDFMPDYNPSARMVEWPNGSMALTFSNEAYEQLRGNQFQFGWIDELAKFRYQQETWDQYSLTLRLGKYQQSLITTTPRPTKLIKELAKDDDTYIVTGSTYDNTALPKAYIEDIAKKYEGTRLGQQELYAHILDDNPNALFKYEDIVHIEKKQLPELQRIVVAIDPAITANIDSDETGIVVAGKDYAENGYILHDGSLRGSPNEWAQAALDLYSKYRADLVVAEVNQGGKMVETIIRNLDEYVNYNGVHASRGKTRRAEPIAALYERHKIHHVGYFESLETQMCEYDPTLEKQQKSPDRMDALVWALTELFGDDYIEPDIF